MDYIIWELPYLKIGQRLSKNITHETGEFSFSWNGKATIVKNIPLLYKNNGEAVTVVNNWLIDIKSSKFRKQVNTQAQALLHYFIFLNDMNISWDEMPVAPRNKPTYLFSHHLRNAVRSGSLARTTANNYLGAVVNFYKFYLSKGYMFSNPPFVMETIKIKSSGNHTQMRENMIFVDTTDLRLNLPKDSSFGGVYRSLVPLSLNEWGLVSKICDIKKEQSINENDLIFKGKISFEFKIAIALARYTGLRRNELITFRSNSIYKPTVEQLKTKYLIHSDGVFISPSIGVETKNSGSRTIEFPSSLMFNLHRYINSKRYIDRKNKFIINHPTDADNPPLLITQNGEYYGQRTFNARWGEVRDSVRKTLPDFSHKFHNLRSTYAVFRLNELLNGKLNEESALDYIQSVMGHKSRSTLFLYLKFCKENTSANETYEQSIDLILKN